MQLTRSAYQCELVARNAEDAEVLELALECIHCEVLRRRTSERRDVNEQYDVAEVLRPVDRVFVVYVEYFVVVDRAIASQRVIAEHLARCFEVGFAGHTDC